VRYRAYGELDGVPNIVVDGARHTDSLLTLSHWPQSGSPPELADDLSAQITFHYLDRPERHVPAEAVSNNHFDQDGLMSVYALVDPDSARARRERVIDVARAGDFGTYRDRDSVRIAWTIASLGDELPGDVDPYPVMLERVPELLDHPEHFVSSWADEDEHLQGSEAAIASGLVTIEERADLDLAIVTVPESWDRHTVHRFTRPPIEAALHPTALFNATGCFRVLTLRGCRYELQYRYETWVQYQSRRPPGRIDLTPLATALTELEPGGARWTFDGVAEIAPSLHLVGDAADPASTIPPEQLRARVIQTLTDGVSAWNPYD
jgi:hypothetical protein